MSEPAHAPAREASGLAAVVAGGPCHEPAPGFWATVSGAPADLVLRLEKASNSTSVLTGSERAQWEDELHRCWALLAIAGRSAGSQGKENQAVTATLRRATTAARRLGDDMLGLITVTDDGVGAAALDVARALFAFQMAAAAALPQRSRPGRPSVAPLRREAQALKALFERHTARPARLHVNAPVVHFVGEMFSLSGAGTLSPDRIYDLLRKPAGGARRGR